MIRHGSAPFLECSTKGDKRFSAFMARVKSRGNQTIEELYQGAKLFALHVDDQLTVRSGLDWRRVRDLKGMTPLNIEACRKLYALLWDEYIAENPHLLEALHAAHGLSDIFGQPGRCCQATELWRIRNGGI